MKINIKTIIGVGIVGAVGYYLWKRSKDKSSVTPTLNIKPDAVPDAGGDAKESDLINTHYELLENFIAPNAIQMSDVPFAKGNIFIKKSIRNGTSFNSKPAIKVSAKDDTNLVPFKIPNEFIIPESLLKKTNATQMPTVKVFDERGISIKPNVITQVTTGGLQPINTKPTLLLPAQRERIKKFQDELWNKTVSGEIKSQADAEKLMASYNLTREMVETYNEKYANK